MDRAWLDHWISGQRIADRIYVESGLTVQALDSMQYRYGGPFVVQEACGDRHAPVNDSNLFDMQAKFAEVLPEEELMKLIDRIKKY